MDLDHKKNNAPSNRVAVLVLTYNHENYIAECLKSIIRSSLNNYHIWILDDGSSDETCAIVESFAGDFGNITLIRQEHSAGSTSGNSQRLIDDSVGEYIVLMSGDDLVGPEDGLWRAVQSLDADPQLAVVMPRMVYLMEDPASSAPECHAQPLLELLRCGNSERILNEYLFQKVSRIFLQSMVIRRNIVEDFHGFDESLIADDYAFVMRMFNYLNDNDLKFYFDEHSLWLYRVHDSSIHRDPIRQFTLIAQVVAKYVPFEYRKKFCWDHVLIQSTVQWKALHQTACLYLGKHDALGALDLTATMMVKTAARAGNVRLILNLLASETLSRRHKLTALRYLWMALFRKCFG